MLYKVYVNGEMIVRYTYDNLCRFVKMNGANIVNSVKYANGSRFAYGRNPHNFEILSVTQSTEDGEANATEIIRSRGLPVEVKSG